jgi:MoxR-like ATPase
MTYKKIETVNELLLPFAFGKKNILRLLEIPLLIKGHLLINDLPGVGKTTLSKAFAIVVGLRFTRLQGTSDTLPQDIIGGEALDPKTREFIIRKGPLFTEVILIDEINRMHPKSQSAFLEAMEEGQVSIAGQAFPLPEQHMVIATQNPLEQSGTYPLPEAQKDRFSCSITIGVPDRDVQKNIISDEKYVDLTDRIEELPQIMSSEDISLLQKRFTR